MLELAELGDRQAERDRGLENPANGKEREMRSGFPRSSVLQTHECTHNAHEASSGKRGSRPQVPKYKRAPVSRLQNAQLPVCWRWSLERDEL